MKVDFVCVATCAIYQADMSIQHCIHSYTHILYIQCMMGVSWRCKTIMNRTP